MKQLMALFLGLLLTSTATAQDNKEPEAKHKETLRQARAARDRGLTYLSQNQAKDGSWGKQYTVAVTSFACLAYLAATEEPFDGDHAKPLTRGARLPPGQPEGRRLSPPGSYVDSRPRFRHAGTVGGLWPLVGLQDQAGPRHAQGP